MSDQGTPVQTMEHLGEVGTHASAEPRGEDQNVEALMFVPRGFHR